MPFPRRSEGTSMEVDTLPRTESGGKVDPCAVSPAGLSNSLRNEIGAMFERRHSELVDRLEQWMLRQERLVEDLLKLRTDSPPPSPTFGGCQHRSQDSRTSAEHFPGLNERETQAGTFVSITPTHNPCVDVDQRSKKATHFSEAPIWRHCNCAMSPSGPWSNSTRWWTTDVEGLQCTGGGCSCQKGLETNVSKLQRYRAYVHWLVGSYGFQVFFVVAILTSSILDGVVTDYQAENATENIPIGLRCFSAIYTGIFTVELTLRIIAHGKCFFFSRTEWPWNYLDTLVVSVSILELLITGLRDVHVLWVLGITWLFRALRVVRIARFVHALRNLIHSITATFKSLVWLIIFSSMIMYVLALVFNQACTTFIVRDGVSLDNQNKAELLKYWGTLPRCVFTLFQCICGGVIWEEAMKPLSDTGGGFYVVLFTCYIAFVYFAALNTVVAAFVLNAFEGAQHDKDIVAQVQIANKALYVERINQLFSDIDRKKSGYVTIKEFEEHLRCESTQAYFQGLHIDVSDAWTFFRLLDKNETPIIDIEDFVMGCMRLRGPATGIDLARLVQENKATMKKISTSMRTIEDKLLRHAQDISYLRHARSVPIVEKTDLTLKDRASLSQCGFFSNLDGEEHTNGDAQNVDGAKNPVKGSRELPDFVWSIGEQTHIMWKDLVDEDEIESSDEPPISKIVGPVKTNFPRTPSFQDNPTFWEVGKNVSDGLKAGNCHGEKRSLPSPPFNRVTDFAADLRAATKPSSHSV